MSPLLAYFGFLAALKMLWKLLSLHRRGARYDVLSVHCTLEALLALSTRWLFRTPVLFVFEGYSDTEARIAKYADLQTALSKPVVDRVYQKFGYRPRLVPIGVDTSVFTPEGEKLPISDRKEKTVILSVCRLTPPKRVHILVEAARIASARNPNLLFYIVGEGPEREKLEGLIREYRLADRVVVTGKVPQERLPVYYRSADIFVSTEPSPDHFWISVLEAIASGLAVIWTYDGSEEYLRTIENWGVPVPPEDPEKLAEALLELARDRKYLEKCKQEALEKSQKYEWDRIIDNYEKVYETVKERRIVFKEISEEQVRKILEDLYSEWEREGLTGYTDWWKEEEKEVIYNSLKRYVYTLNFLPSLPNSSKVLDLSTGYGHLAILVKRLFDYEVFATDISTPKILKRRFERENITYRVCNLPQGPIPFTEENFDMVLFNDTLCFLPGHPKDLFLRIRSILKDKGTLVVEVPNRLNLIRRIKILFGKEQTDWKEEFPHIHHYTKKELEDILELSGFCVKKSKFFNYAQCKSSFLRTIGIFIHRILCKVRPSLSDAIIVNALKTEGSG
jgi:glycosyltransferase involved in cell wall biosynthesis/SAM-dependent methyltransferase